MPRKAYIRADGSPSIGLGHLVRCQALAYMLKGEYAITFVCKEVPQAIADDITTAGYSILNIADEADFMGVLTGNEIVILDHYGLDSGYQRTLKGLGCTVVCIDDLQEGEFFADLIINHAPGITPAHYRAQPYTRFALGLKFALLRPAFLQAAKQPAVFRSGKAIFICFGGADPENLTMQAVEAAAEMDLFDTINVVTGAAYPYRGSLSELTDRRIHLYSALSENEMCALMQDSDIAIVPSSTILLEAVSCGLNIITCYYAGNQKDFHDNMVKLGLATTGIVSGDYKNNLFEKLRHIKGQSSVNIRTDFAEIEQNILKAFRYE